MSDSRTQRIQAEAAREAAALWPAWFDAVRRAEVDAAIRALHADLDRAVAERGATCWQSGDCCRFDDYGHRLYVTGLEAAWFLDQRMAREREGDADRAVTGAVGPDAARGDEVAVRLPMATPAPPASSATACPACPYQIDNRCTVHAVRPMGCRVFFCEPGTEDWQRDAYERFHARMQRLHTAHGLVYRYMEWRAALEQGAGGRGVGV